MTESRPGTDGSAMDDSTATDDSSAVPRRRRRRGNRGPDATPTPGSPGGAPPIAAGNPVAGTNPVLGGNRGTDPSPASGASLAAPQAATGQLRPEPARGKPRGSRRKPERQPDRQARDGERGWRDLVGNTPSQLGVSGAMRARDAARPTLEDLARAERDLTIVRRQWKPPEETGR